MMVYEDEIVMHNAYNNDDDDADKVYVAENDIEMKMMDDQAMVVDIVLLLAVDLISNDVKVMLVNALIPTIKKFNYY